MTSQAKMNRVAGWSLSGRPAKSTSRGATDSSRRRRPTTKRTIRECRKDLLAMGSPLGHSAISAGCCNRCNVETMLFDAMDLGATFVFAISGATRGVRRRLDLLGGLLVAWAAAVAGGIARDLLIGAVPPASIADWRYLAAAVAAGLLGFFASHLIGRPTTPVPLCRSPGVP